MNEIDSQGMTLTSEFCFFWFGHVFRMVRSKIKNQQEGKINYDGNINWNANW